MSQGCMGCAGCNRDCDCSGSSEYDVAEAMILGSGDDKTQVWAQNTREALNQLGRDASIEFNAESHMLAIFGLHTWPALVYRGQVVGYGEPVAVAELVKLLKAIE